MTLDAPPLERGTFAVIGAQKAGTTALSSFLACHPAICMSEPMETHFFDRARYFQSDLPPYVDYHRAVFPHYKGERAVGWSTPSIMFQPEAISRLARYNPEMRLVVLLRHPVERAFSHYRMQVAAGLESLPFRAALDREPERLAEGTDFGEPGLLYSYASRGLYGPQIDELLRCFDREQVLFVASERLRHDHGGALTSIFRFLGVATPTALPEARMCRVGQPGSLDPADRELLLGYYAATVARLRDDLGWELDSWCH